MRLKWSNELPTKKGWYWCQEWDMWQGIREVLVDGFWRCYDAGSEQYLIASETVGAKWAGPIEEPED